MPSHWWVLPLLLTPCAAAASDQGPQDLSNLSIEELAQIPVRSASKHEEPLSGVPTALYVITSDDIARSAALSLPEVLREAPNLQVERVNASQYAITARGFNGYESANKLLVLIDGRSVYSTIHSGVFWDLHAPLLEDIDQVEVISGPGGTLYGPNAVNGVINISSKDAFDAQGLLVRGTAGDRDRTAGARYGFTLGDSAAMRVYANWYDREDMPNASAGPAVDDGIRGWQAGFRADAHHEADKLTLQGDIFGSDRFLAPGDGDRGQNLLTRWQHELTPGSSFQVQAYYDYFQRREQLTVDRLETVDVEAQYNLKTGPHNLVAGGGVRTTRDQFINNLNIFQLDPQRARLWVGNGFVQDRFAVSRRLSVIAGIKLEGSTFSGVQVLPNLRIAWQPSNRATLWAAVSRAVRTPSRIDRDLMAPGLLATAPDFTSEKLTAFEAGYRGQPTSSTTLSLSTYYNIYRDLRSITLIGNPFPLQIANDLRGHTYGVEAWATQQIAPWWRLSAGASWLKKEFDVRPGAVDFSAGASLGHDPDYQVSLRSQVTLPQGVRFDLGLRAVDGLESPDIQGYAEADARVGWDVSKRVELYLAGENLLHDSHLESNDLQRAQRIPRTIYAGSRLRF
jgi:iron complex outermembrane receptor protein